MPFVLDASVALRWHFRDEVSPYANRVLSALAEQTALVPSIWPLEIANALAVAERRGRLDPARVTRAVELYRELPIAVHEVPVEDAFGPVLEVARDHRLTAYDAAYLELAMREGVPLATEDQALRESAGRVGVAVLDPD